MIKSATLSDCKTYRYELSRIWDDSLPLFLYIGVNPSTADALKPDQTTKKWTGFTERNGGGGFLVVNLFAFRAKNVTKLADASDPLGPMNFTYIINSLSKVNLVVPCWGARAKVPKHLRFMLEMVEQVVLANEVPSKCLGYTKSGDPLHPLTLSYKTPLIEYRSSCSSCEPLR